MLTLKVYRGEEVEEIHLPEAGEMTVADYIRMMDTNEEGYQALAKAVGLKPEEVLAMPVREAEALQAWYQDRLKESAEGWARTHSLEAVLEREHGENWRKELAVDKAMELGLVPRSFVVDGQEYLVPLRMDEQTTYGQWVDLEATLDMMAKDDMSLARSLPVILATMCVRSGERYATVNFQERRKVMEGAKAMEALQVVAFFLSNSERFAGCMLRASLRHLEWMRPLTEPEQTPS